MLSSHELERYRQTLYTLRGQLESRLSQLLEEASHGTGGQSSGGISNAPIHLADLGNQQAEQEVNIALAENEGFLRQEIDQALARLEEGKFGICEECHGAIGAERLKALPYTRLCIRCANRLQKE